MNKYILKSPFSYFASRNQIHMLPQDSSLLPLSFISICSLPDCPLHTLSQSLSSPLYRHLIQIAGDGPALISCKKYIRLSSCLLWMFLITKLLKWYKSPLMFINSRYVCIKLLTIEADPVFPKRSRYTSRSGGFNILVLSHNLFTNFYCFPDKRELKCLPPRLFLTVYKLQVSVVEKGMRLHVTRARDFDHSRMLNDIFGNWQLNSREWFRKRTNITR